MDLQLTDQHVLITGGSKGIGLACAQGFLREGARVSLIARDAVGLDEARQRLLAYAENAHERITLVAADLRDTVRAERAIGTAETAFGPVDVLVTCAGAAQRTPPAELTAQAWHDALDAKFFSYIHVIDPVVRRMGQRGRGAIVNVIGAGGKVASPIHLPGGSANAALMLATAGLAAAYAPMGVRVNAVNPGATRTERLTQGLEAAARQGGTDVDEALGRTTKNIPLGRIAEPDEVANVVLFLASACASYVTGVVLTMDGAANPIVV